jgi:HSP20 family molecular chaperone IbpA
VKKSKVIGKILSATTAGILVTPPLGLAAQSASNSTASPPAQSAGTTIEQRTQQLESEMDSIFKDTFQKFGNWFEQSKFASSIDLREQNDSYVVRLFMPNADTSKVNATVNGNALHITVSGQQGASQGNTSQRYEQTIGLPGPVQAGKLKIDRKQDLVVITVPKSQTSVASNGSSRVASPPSSPSASPPPGSVSWDQSIVNEMQRMEGRMDQLLRDGFPGNLTSGSSNLELGSAINVKDENDKYVVHFYLPDSNFGNVNVKYENGELELTADEQRKATQSGESSTLQSSGSERYQEMVTLPGPVKDKNMIVDRKSGAVVVTLPKA